MTARECWEGLLTELSKVNAPSMLLTDFNYFFKKAVNQYINKRYNIYDVNQLTTDDLRVLKSTAILKPSELTNYGSLTEEELEELKAGDSNLFGGVRTVNLPLDYVHLLNCECIFHCNSNYKCWDKGNFIRFGAKRLTADAWPVIMNDYYNRPLPWRPYYYIHNVNTSNALPTNAYNNPLGLNYLSENATGTDASRDYAKGSNLPRTIHIQGTVNNSLVQKEAGLRYGNATPIRMEIRYGDDDKVFDLRYVKIDYLKAPQEIRLTQALVSQTEDTSQIMEFPDYVCQEIINEMVMLVMENTADPRLSTNLQVSQSIASPSQQLAAIQPRLQTTTA